MNWLKRLFKREQPSEYNLYQLGWEHGYDAGIAQYTDIVAHLEAQIFQMQQTGKLARISIRKKAEEQQTRQMLRLLKLEPVNPADVPLSAIETQRVPRIKLDNIPKTHTENT